MLRIDPWPFEGRNRVAALLPQDLFEQLVVAASCVDLSLRCGISSTSMMPTDLVAWFHLVVSVNPFVNMSAAISAEVVYSQFYCCI